jgi:uncharacterized damage-inducible protein DinB
LPYVWLHDEVSRERAMIHNELQQLVRHMEWADAVVWGTLLGEPQARADTQIRECIHHTHQVQWAYLQIWRGEQLSIPDLGEFQDLVAVYEWCRTYYLQATEFLATLEPAALERTIDFPWAKELVKQYGEARRATLAECLLQITSHSTYHRGQVNRRLRELGAEPPLTDFVAWIWMGQPAPEWKSAKTD